MVLEMGVHWAWVEPAKRGHSTHSERQLVESCRKDMSLHSNQKR